ncbi:hypothetical protein [Halalkalicoccus ordinarius]
MEMSSDAPEERLETTPRPERAEEPPYPPGSRNEAETGVEDA